MKCFYMEVLERVQVFQPQTMKEFPLPPRATDAVSCRQALDMVVLLREPIS